MGYVPFAGKNLNLNHFKKNEKKNYLRMQLAKILINNRNLLYFKLNIWPKSNSFLRNN